MAASRAALAVVLGLALAHAGVPVAAYGQSQPHPEPNFAGQVLPPRPCALDTSDPYETKLTEMQGWDPPDYVRYPGACERLRFAYGPIVVKPGQNDVLVSPVTIEKPAQDGYVTRFKPNLVDQNGKVPPVEQIHLHHGTWLSQPTYGSGPFFASGEEKTVAPFPQGYGMPIKATDVWLLLYMVHSAVAQPMTVYITYDVDFVPQAKAEALKMETAVPVWLDVRPSGYPVFNVQRGFGSDGRCTWPRQKCAAFDPYGKTIVGQGLPGNGRGEDLVLPAAGQPLGVVPNFTGGTLIGIGGHLHPGGIQNEIDLFRPGGEDVTVTPASKVRAWRSVCTKRRRGHCVKRKRRYARAPRGRTETVHVDTTRIYNGRAHYWSHTDSSQEGGPPTSWDFSMEIQGLPRWGVHVKPGDHLRSNATYDTNTLASYEDMGIAVTLLAPDTPDGKPTAPGVDPLAAPRDDSPDCQSGPEINGKLCEVGVLSHGHYAENGNHSGPSGSWTAMPSGETRRVAIADFQYLPGDLSSNQVPQVKLGTNLQFVNAEGATIYHTITTCAFPCLGPTSADFPLPNGLTSLGRPIDLDSTELGIGVPEIGPTSQKLDWSIPVDEQQGYKPGEVVTYFCRVHPFMRGAFEVVK